VPEKAEAFPDGALAGILRAAIICGNDYMLAAPDRERLRFFRPITRRIKLVGASFLAITFIAICAYSVPAISLNWHQNMPM
jgi:hypothetical protein